MKEENLLKSVACVTCFGRLVSVHANPENAFREQMQLVQKGKAAELVVMPIVYDLK